MPRTCQAQSAGPGSEAERADLRELVRDAIDGLNPAERDVIELSLGHEFQGEDLADALGVSRNHAHALLSRARGQLERSLGALLVARTGRDACPELAAMLTGWDGQLTVLMRKRISRHIERCEICGERKRRELSPALLAGLAPLAALTPGFRDHVLRVMADRGPAGLAHRLGVANRAGPFGPAGFPRPGRPPGPAPWHRAPVQAVLRHKHAAVGGAATAVVVAGVIAAAVMGGSSHGPSSAAGPPGGGNQGAAAGARGPTPARGGSSASGPSAGGLSASAASGLTPVVARSGGATAPSASAAPGPASSTSPAAATPAAGSSSSPAATVSPGTVTVSPGTLDLVTVSGTATGRLTITAHGGPVSSYSVTAGSALAGRLTVSPSSGSLANGASATITVTSTSLVALDGTLTVNPGGDTITVVLSVGV